MIVGGLEREVGVVRFLPAGRLEDPAEINEGDPNLDELTARCCVNTFPEFCQ